MHPEGCRHSEEEQQKYLPLALDYIPEDLKRRAKFELHEDEDTRIHSLKLLRSMLNAEPDLNYQDDDLFLLAFLRARKFDVKRALQLMKTFYMAKAKRGEISDNYNFEDVRKIFKENCVGFLTQRDNEGCAIIVIRAGKWNPQKNTATEMMRTLSSGLFFAILSPATHIAGFKVIIDFADFTWSHVPYVPPTYIWLLGEVLQNCFPGRFRAIHIVNEGAIFSYFWIILKKLLTKKIRERFHCHGKNVKKLHKYIPSSILPAEFEGDLPPFDNTEWGKMMSEKADCISEFFKYGYQKSKAKSQDNRGQKHDQ